MNLGPTDAQEAALADLNNQWGAASWKLDDSGVLHVV